ncbi:MAG: glycine cleavage T C-terminal barrel domain-containing protein [Actinomycetota bacterium]
MAQISIGSRVRKSPFYDSTVAAGVASFTIYNNMYMPTGYGDPDAEYERLTQRVALWDVAVERQIQIAGPDASKLTQYVCARDLSNMTIGRAKYAPMCDHQGRLINDPVVLRVAEDRYWLSIADSDMLLWVSAVAGERGDDAEVTEPDVSPLGIQGPMAADLARDLFGAEIVDSLGFFHHRPVELDGIPIELCRSGWSKQGGFELFLTDGSQGNRLWDLVMTAGAKYGIGPGNPNQPERIESGLLSYGSDNARDTDPIEAGLHAYTSLNTDVDFCGKAALIERQKRAVRRPIVNITFTGNKDVAEWCRNPWPASVSGEQIGELRNATWSHRLDRWIGIAQLETPHDAAGTIIDVVTGSGNKVRATVTDEPFGAIRTK